MHILLEVRNELTTHYEKVLLDQKLAEIQNKLIKSAFKFENERANVEINLNCHDEINYNHITKKDKSAIPLWIFNAENVKKNCETLAKISFEVFVKKQTREIVKSCGVIYPLRLQWLEIPKSSQPSFSSDSVISYELEKLKESPEMRRKIETFAIPYEIEQLSGSKNSKVGTGSVIGPTRSITNVFLLRIARNYLTTFDHNQL